MTVEIVGSRTEEKAMGCGAKQEVKRSGQQRDFKAKI